MPFFAIPRAPTGVILQSWHSQRTGMAMRAGRRFSRGFSTANRASKTTRPLKAQLSRPASSSSSSSEALRERRNTPTAASSSSSSSSSSALRTAEARESALRAARLRRQGQEQDRQAEEAKRAQEKRDYEVRYKAAGRKWTSSIIALPILLVTSYYLFDRLMLGHAPKELPRMKDRDGDGER